MQVLTLAPWRGGAPVGSTQQVALTTTIPLTHLAGQPASLQRSDPCRAFAAAASAGAAVNPARASRAMCGSFFQPGTRVLHTPRVGRDVGAEALAAHGPRTAIRAWASWETSCCFLCRSRPALLDGLVARGLRCESAHGSVQCHSQGPTTMEPPDPAMSALHPHARTGIRRGRIWPCAAGAWGWWWGWVECLADASPTHGRS